MKLVKMHNMAQMDIIVPICRKILICCQQHGFLCLWIISGFSQFYICVQVSFFLLLIPTEAKTECCIKKKTTFIVLQYDSY